MESIDSSFHEQVRCVRRRVAETGCFAVDACDCGTMHVHLGAISLRLSPCAMRELVTVLDRALQAKEDAAPTDISERIN